MGPSQKRKALAASATDVCNPLICGACSSVVECPLMVRRVVRSNPHGGPVELFIVTAP